MNEFSRSYSYSPTFSSKKGKSFHNNNNNNNNDYNNNYDPSNYYDERRALLAPVEFVSPPLLHEKYVTIPLQRYFRRWGRYVALNPCFVISCSLLFFFICAAGFFWLEQEYRVEYLWSPKTSAAWDDYIERIDIYGNPDPIETMMVVGKKGYSNNMLTPTALKDMLDLHDTIYYNVSARYKGETYTYITQCARYTSESPCRMYNVLALWEYDRTEIENLTQELILLRIRLLQDQIGAMVGSFIYDEDGLIIGAEALLFTYYAKADEDDFEGPTISWEQAYLDEILLKKNKEKRPAYDIYVRCDRSLYDEIQAIVTGDIPIIVLAMIISLIFVCAILGKRTVIHSRAALGTLSLTTVLMALVVAFGLSGYFKVYVTVLSPMIIFILLGIGVDGMIIITDSLELTSNVYPLEDRIGDALATSGVTITMTRVTAFVAFMVGSNVPISAIQYFCYTAAFAIIGLYVLQSTFFIGFLVLDTRRQLNHRVDCFCCIVIPNERAAEMEKQAGETDVVRKWMHFKYAPLLLSNIGRVIVIVLFLALAIFGAWCWGELESGLPLEDGFRDDSYLGAYFEETAIYFPGLPTPLEAITTDNDYTDPIVQEKLRQLKNDLEISPIVIPPVLSWFSSFESWAISQNLTYVGDDFYPSLNLFTSTSDLSDPFIKDLRYDDEGLLIAARMNTLHRWQNDVAPRIKDMDDLYDLYAAIDLNGFLYAEWFIYNERDRIVEDLTLQNLTFAIIAVLAVLPFFVDLRTAGMIGVCLLFIDLDLFALMYVWDTKLEIGSFICLCMAIGLSVDYCVHIGIAYFNFHGTRKEQVQGALGEIGPSVIMGALSTMLSISLLYFTHAESFRIFFKMLFGAISFGLLQGIVLFPVMMSFIGGLRHPPKTSDLTKSSRAVQSGKYPDDFESRPYSSISQPQKLVN